MVSPLGGNKESFKVFSHALCVLSISLNEVIFLSLLYCDREFRFLFRLF